MKLFGCKKKIGKIILITSVAVLEILQIAVIAVLIIIITGRDPLDDINPLEDRMTYSRGDYEVELKGEDYVELYCLLDDFTVIIPDPTAGYAQYDTDTINIYYANGEKHTIVLRRVFGVKGKIYGRIEYDGKIYLVDPWMVMVFEYALEPYRNDYYKYKKSLDN